MRVSGLIRLKEKRSHVQNGTENRQDTYSTECLTNGLNEKTFGVFCYSMRKGLWDYFLCLSIDTDRMCDTHPFWHVSEILCAFVPRKQVMSQNFVFLFILQRQNTDFIFAFFL